MVVREQSWFRKIELFLPCFIDLLCAFQVAPRDPNHRRADSWITTWIFVSLIPFQASVRSQSVFLFIWILSIFSSLEGFMWPTNYGQLSVKFVPNPGISSKNRTRGVERQLSRRLIELIRESDVVRSSTPLAAVILSVLWMLLGTVRHLSFLFPHCCPWIIARGGL
jgi:hypothetical protein